MKIPTIGGAKGIFEIFVPGTFFLLNLCFVIHILPFTDIEIESVFALCISNPILSLISIVCFGYLVGILLRLLQTSFPDKLSAVFLSIFSLCENSYETKLWSTDEFPYIGWIEESCKHYLPPDAQNFYNKIWKQRQKIDRDGKSKQNRQFFNFVKVLISSIDERTASEIYAAESLSRYISGMFYAISFSFVLIFFTLIMIFVASEKFLFGLVLVLVLYLFAIMIILKYFRFIRIKEVEIVFAASFRNKEAFENSKF